ncbi:hypothetical protein Slin15195_G041870 [Septoria linicola]|uniref:Uncharacterized protein n=1 Tax=Septoria linicola TaxID=215465 RepID=A0A9Q9EJ05_9PEZI|nr:hypothetical protein Slin14017_G045380 [Septoria linicola]USW50868.1 hypothetical protein Slin15195_G041870 [Septoria linicola]
MPRSQVVASNQLLSEKVDISGPDYRDDNAGATIRQEDDSSRPSSPTTALITGEPSDPITSRDFPVSTSSGKQSGSTSTADEMLVQNHALLHAASISDWHDAVSGITLDEAKRIMSAARPPTIAQLLAGLSVVFSNMKSGKPEEGVLGDIVSELRFDRNNVYKLVDLQKRYRRQEFRKVAVAGDLRSKRNVDISGARALCFMTMQIMFIWFRTTNRRAFVQNARYTALYPWQKGDFEYLGANIVPPLTQALQNRAKRVHMLEKQVKRPGNSSARRRGRQGGCCQMRSVLVGSASPRTTQEPPGKEVYEGRQCYHEGDKC